MILSLLSVLFLGFLCGLIPGPVVTAVFTETIRRGKTQARRVILAAAAGEALMAVTCVAALSFLQPDSLAFPVLSLFGALILASLAWDLWKVEEIHEHEPLFTNRRIFFLALFNGMAWIFWISVCAPQAVALGRMIPFGNWIFVFLFELGWLASTFLLSHLFHFFRPYFQSNRKLHLFYRGIAILFVLFALKLAIESARALLH